VLAALLVLDFYHNTQNQELLLLLILLNLNTVCP